MTDTTDTSQKALMYTRWNPPGQTQLSYRAGTYTTVLQRLIAYLTTHADPNNIVPVLQLDTDPHENWGVGLLQAWAIVIDVLTFYQERIANEGYLRTATERRSIVELARSIGYELRPGVSASSYLALKVRNGNTASSQRCIIPKGAAVQSVPTQGQQVLSLPDVRKPPTTAQLPQIFETSEEFEARPEWNAIKPAEMAQISGRTFRPGTTSLRLAGIKTGLRTGDAILIVGDDPSYTDQNRPWIFAFVTAVEPNVKKGYTQVTWAGDVKRNNDLYFQLKATLVISADYAVLVNTIVTNVRKELTTSFGFDRREFSQPISVSEVISVMQHVTGVVAVKLESLYIKGQSAALNTVLEAKPGRLEAGTLRPAQLLLINAEDEQGIILRVETPGV